MMYYGVICLIYISCRHCTCRGEWAYSTQTQGFRSLPKTQWYSFTHLIVVLPWQSLSPLPQACWWCCSGSMLSCTAGSIPLQSCCDLLTECSIRYFLFFTHIFLSCQMIWLCLYLGDVQQQWLVSPNKYGETNTLAFYISSCDKIKVWNGEKQGSLPSIFRTGGTQPLSRTTIAPGT